MDMKYYICDLCRIHDKYTYLQCDDMANAVDHLLTAHRVDTEDNAKHILRYCETTIQDSK